VLENAEGLKLTKHTGFFYKGEHKDRRGSSTTGVITFVCIPIELSFKCL
jgi:hypothetical protein